MTALARTIESGIITAEKLKATHFVLSNLNEARMSIEKFKESMPELAKALNEAIEVAADEMTKQDDLLNQYM
jgi:hypothetical protein